MGMKLYDYRGSLYQFQEGTEPAGAVLRLAAGAPVNKGRKPANKAGKASAVEGKAAAEAPHADEADAGYSDIEDATDPNSSEA